jgi:hypothetical protein
MQTTRRSLCFGIVGLAVAIYLKLAMAEDPISAPGVPATSAATADGASKQDAADKLPRVSLEVARDRAQLMHDIYSATLETMHRRYFHGDRAVIPARAMQDVFKTIERDNHSQAHWISASLAPMSIDHEPKTDFEKHAAGKLAKGEEMVETIEEGYYRRAGSIPLTSGCVGCHGGLFAGTSSTRKFAGLIISIPVDRNARLTNDEKKPVQ